MPGMGGRELSRALASRRPTLPILFMSGYNDDGELAGAGGDLGTGVLAKPFTSETLARHVREALDRRPTRAAPRWRDRSPSNANRGGRVARLEIQQPCGGAYLSRCRTAHLRYLPSSLSRSRPALHRAPDAT